MPNQRLINISEPFNGRVLRDPFLSWRDQWPTQKTGIIGPNLDQRSPEDDGRHLLQQQHLTAPH
jgi:hypothetical protein